MRKVLSLILTLFLILTGITFPASAEAAARVDELKNSQAIQEMVRQYAPDPEKWWAWFEDQPLEGTEETGVGRLYVLEWIEIFASLSEEERMDFNYNPLLFAITGPEDSISPAKLELSRQDETDAITAKIGGSVAQVKMLIAQLMR